MITEQRTDSITTNLEQLLQSGDSSARPFTVLTGHNMGNNTLILCVPMHQFAEISEVANERNINENAAFAEQPVAQRKLDPNHSAKLAAYIIKGLFYSVELKYKQLGQEVSEKFREMQKALGKQPYLALQPLTANIRECQPGGKDLRVEQSPDGKVVVYLSDKHILWIVDGQHRREAMRLVFEFLKALLNSYKYPKLQLYPGADKGQEATPDELKVWAAIFDAARTRCKVLVETHLGLDAEQERQLFHDLNNLTKKVESSLAFKFDNSNPINLFIKDELIGNGLFNSEQILDRDVVDWQEDKGGISRKDIISVNAMLFLNKTNISGASPREVEEKRDYAVRFWQEIVDLPHFGAPGAKKNTVAAQPVVLKAIAKLAYSFAYGRGANPELLELLFNGISKIDFSHENKMWRYYLLPQDERDLLCPGLKEYLPDEATGFNRDIGAFDPTANVMRFGAKHNDIHPVLGDMIRWTLSLPTRRKTNNDLDENLHALALG